MSNSDLIKRMSKGGQVASKSDFFSKKSFITTSIPALNIALSGNPHEGLTSGFIVIAGPSRTYKSLLSLLMVAAYLRDFPEAVCVFYDTEFGITLEYMESQGIDTSRVIHIVAESAEKMKFDITQKLEEIQKGDKVIILVDSFGNMASDKETQDALDGKAVADMTRAKALKSLFRLITARLVTKDIPCIGIAHTYQEIGLFPKTIIGGGTGIMYAANIALIMGKQQMRDGKELTGFQFNLNIEKSRYVKEKTKIGLEISFDEGIYKYSGLLDLALESGHIVKPSNGWFSLVDQTTGEVQVQKYRRADTDEILEQLLQDKSFINFIESKYKLSNKSMVIEKLSSDKELVIPVDEEYNDED